MLTYHRPQKNGPELAIQDAAIHIGPSLLRSHRFSVWKAGSARIGAGYPDVLIVSYRAATRNLAGTNEAVWKVLAYLRVVRAARRITIAKRCSIPLSRVDRAISHLKSAGALRADGNAIALKQDWKNLLPEVVSIEAKVGNWRGAFSQAMRNALFSTQSYIALNERSAQLALRDHTFRRSHIGVISVNKSGEAELLKPAKERPLKLLVYYYMIGARIANEASERTRALQYDT